LVQPPAGLVHLVDALVAQVAVAGVPDPVPVVVQPLAHQRLLGGGTAPQVIVHGGGRLLRALDLADGAAQLVADAAGHADLAALAGVEEGNGLAHAGHAAALGAGLADAFVLAGALDDAPALADVVGDGLFDVDALARLQGPDGGQRVPVV